MKMTRTTIAIASLLAVAGFAASTADALTLPKWWHTDETVAKPAAAPATVAPAPIEPLRANALPNYRAIVHNYGPAVVGVTVSGMRDIGNDNNADNDDDAPSLDNDPFFRFFRGVPGLRLPPQGRVP